MGVKPEAWAPSVCHDSSMAISPRPFQIELDIRAIHPLLTGMRMTGPGGPWEQRLDRPRGAPALQGLPSFFSLRARL